MKLDSELKNLNLMVLSVSLRFLCLSSSLVVVVGVVDAAVAPLARSSHVVEDIDASVVSTGSDSGSSSMPTFLNFTNIFPFKSSGEGNVLSSSLIFLTINRSPKVSYNKSWTIHWNSTLQCISKLKNNGNGVMTKANFLTTSKTSFTGIEEVNFPCDTTGPSSPSHISISMQRQPLWRALM
ncbi:hypothetical protein WICPIJ_005599 [Wickerhamomyces pijperi]|uniref:Uncharacterized protein n=1 Tax=Wickerhamomyces pijperi TaxID=599730 RepID=A0A9P8Q5H2_WICPI|nr:hypothetical protein WICPIJ_005599 [Wickerhamomyces pijperi]